MKYHLAILTPGWTELILDGSKTIESRFTKVRCAPFGQVNAGDIVYMKESGGLVKGMFTVAKVETFENLTEGQICNLFYKEYREQIFASLSASMQRPPDKWLTAKHATLIHVSGSPIAFDEPFPYRQKGRSAWLVLNAPLHDRSTLRGIAPESLVGFV